MSKFKIEYPSGATPIDLDEIKDLIPDYVSTMSEVNQVEQTNIADAFVWVGKQDSEDLLSATFFMKQEDNLEGLINCDVTPSDVSPINFKVN